MHLKQHSQNCRARTQELKREKKEGYQQELRVGRAVQGLQGGPILNHTLLETLIAPTTLLLPASLHSKNTNPTLQSPQFGAGAMELCCKRELCEEEEKEEEGEQVEQRKKE